MLTKLLENSARTVIVLLIVSMAFGLSAQPAAAKHGRCPNVSTARDCCPTAGDSCRNGPADADADCCCKPTDRSGLDPGKFDPAETPASSDCCADGCRLCCAPACRTAFPANDAPVAGGELAVTSLALFPLPQFIPATVHESIFHPPRA